MNLTCDDPVILNQWHPLSSFDEIAEGATHHTVLLEQPVSYQMTSAGDVSVWLRDDIGCTLPLKRAYGFLWTCLGTPPDDIFSIFELVEPDRQNVATGVFGVNVSFGRAIENFLDMGHFPFVHTGILGEEPHTEVKEYDVEVSESRDEIMATRCRFYQPRAALVSDAGPDVDYVFRFPHINCSLIHH